MIPMPTDTQLPGLALLLQPDRLVDHIRNLSALPPSTTARIGYIKYKPGTNCLVGYQFDTGTALLDGYARALRPDDYDNLRSDIRHGCLQLNEQSLELRLFPYDRHLPALRRLCDPERQHRLLKRLFPRQPDWWCGQLERLAYKPERRYVARLIVNQWPVAVLKFHTGEAYQRAFQVATVLPEHTSLTSLLGYSEREHVLAYAWREGREVSAALLDEHWPISTFAQIGTALAAFQAQPCHSLTIRHTSDEIHALHAAAQAIIALYPALLPRIQLLIETLSIHLNTMPILQGLIHGDFYARQVLIDSENTHLIDYDEAACGNQLLDLANMLAHIENDVLRGALRRERADQARAALLSGYFQPNTMLPTSILNRLIAIRLLLLAPQPFRSFEAHWPARIAAIVERCEELQQEDLYGRV